MMYPSSMIERTLSKKIKNYSRQYPVITLTGPRQSGKTTLCKMLFDKHLYYSLEDLDVRKRAQDDPKTFLEGCLKKGAVLDEIQRVPELTSYIQGIVDKEKRDGLFILTTQRKNSKIHLFYGHCLHLYHSLHIDQKHQFLFFESKWFSNIVVTQTRTSIFTKNTNFNFFAC